VPIPVVTIIITLMFLGKTGHWHQKRTAQQQDCYEPFHRQ